MRVQVCSGKRGVAGGHGFVGAVGVRYRYTEPVCEEGEGSGRSKCASTAASDEALYKSVLCRVQEVANGVVRIVESWAPHFREELQNQRAVILELRHHTPRCVCICESAALKFATDFI